MLLPYNCHDADPTLAIFIPLPVSPKLNWAGSCTLAFIASIPILSGGTVELTGCVRFKETLHDAPAGMVMDLFTKDICWLNEMLPPLTVRPVYIPAGAVFVNNCESIQTLPASTV